MMKNKPYIILGFLEAKPGKEHELKEILQTLVTFTLKEPGCIKYELLQCRDNRSQFMFNEHWIDQDAFKIHSMMPYIQSWESRKEEFLATPNKVTAWEIIE